jgi:predicted O-methyltransferase YrrM
MQNLTKKLKNVWGLNLVRRVFNASKYYNKKYIEILKWSINSREDTNYTYELTHQNILEMANVIAIVTKKDFELVMNYINEAINHSHLKNHIIEETKKSKYLKFADLKCNFAKRLGWYAFVRIVKPKIVVETGIDKGLGSVLLCAALLKNREEGFEGAYFGTDINPEAGYLLSGIYREVGTILYGDSVTSLKQFQYPIDIFINDSDHSSEYEYTEYMTIKRLLTEESIILGDNSHVSDKLAIFSRENNRHFLFFKETPKDHWYPGGGIGISFSKQR